MNRTKLVATVILTLAALTMITSNQLAIHSSAITEDDGWVEGDYEGSLEEQEEQAEEDWEDAGRPGDTDNDDNDDNDDNEEQMFTCSDGSTVTEDEECTSIRPNPYCDTDRGKAALVCHDRLDYDQNSGLYPCNDGTSKVNWRDCKDATEKHDSDNDGPDKTVVIKPPQLSQPQILSIRTCEQIGASDGNGLMFNMEIYKICGDNYTNSFISGCEQFYKELGFVAVRCERVVEANIT